MVDDTDNKIDYWIIESVKDQTFDDLFIVDNEVASGPFGTVLKCHPQGNEKISVSAKVLQKNKSKKVVQREVSPLLKLNHPNVSRFIEVVESPDEIYLISEFLNGGQVLERVCKRTKFNERIASKILKQILEGIQYIHQECLVHGNLKPENIMYENAENEDGTIKITDTALNAILDKDLVKSSLNHSAQYCVAPETLRNESGNPATDMWAVGAFAYSLLCGEEPFKTKDQEELYTKILKAEIDTESPNFKRLSINARDFILKLMTDDPKKRMTVQQALNNQWLLGKAANLKTLPTDSLQALIAQKNKQTENVENKEE